MNNSISATFSGDAPSAYNVTEFAALEQKDVPESSTVATIKDAAAMLKYVQQGNSAFDYIADNCSSMRIVNGEVVITLGFYVWVSDLDLEYELRTTIGEISNTKTLHVANKGFDILFEGTNSVDLGKIFEGTLTPLMPFYTSGGVDISPDPDITLKGSSVFLSGSCYTVLRAEGLVKGYYHELEITLSTGNVVKVDPKTGEQVIVQGYKIPSPKIIVDWGEEVITADDDEDDITYDSLELEIPACVEALLGACATAEGTTNVVKRKEGGSLYYVYWNTCTGEIIKSFWSENE